MYFLIKFKKNKFKILTFIIIVLLLNIFYNKNKISYKLVNYNKNTKIYLDRDYLDTSNSKYLEGKKLLKIERHNGKNIWIFTNGKLEIFRPICLNNDNSFYKSWIDFKMTINIKGISCTHKKVYYKKFESFIIKLRSGGPIASDPIFINNINKKKIYILNKQNL